MATNDDTNGASRFQALHEIFEETADLLPRAVAVTHAQETVAYGDLEARANRLARHLRARGVGPGSLVAILLPRSVDAYAALLGVLKAGAAYVPLDVEFPADRVDWILEDCGAQALVTTAEHVARHPCFRGERIRMDADGAALAAETPARLSREEVGVGPQDLCYVIYTSGSTGRPKGVLIEHHSACHLVCAEGRIFRVLPEDRVYQGFSLSFDASVEEVWLAFRAGARLVAATAETTRAGPDLPRWLAESGVTVLSCVPTLLSMLEKGVPTLRLLILGGEACPAQLVERFARPGLRMVNTYGPTEATVIATYADLRPGRPVTIGRAVPGYRVRLLDGRLRPVRRGRVGEICIGGAGVARGYLGLPQQTHARFVADPLAPTSEPCGRMYRTGDLGRLDSKGDLEFVGRDDGQVKVRGFRVELGEIESHLLRERGVRAAACALREDVPGVPELVGYVVPSDAPVDLRRLRTRLRSRLPAHMVPASITTIADLPRRSSGKLDRAALPPPHRTVRRAVGARPRTEAQRRLARIWEALFRTHPLSIHDDFFVDLGGHSLLAARLVSEMRKDPRFRNASVIDVYEHPTIAALAAAFDGVVPRPPAPRTAQPADPRGLPDGRWRHVRAGILQAIALPFVLGLVAFQWVTPYLVYFLLLAGGRSALESAMWAAASLAAAFPVVLWVAVATKWVVLGRVRAGRYPLWSGYYLRWWFAQAVLRTVPLDRLGGTPLLGWVFRLLGARIGRNVHLETDRLAAFDLISIDDDACVDEDALLLGYTVEDGELVLEPVRVGRGAFVGTRAVLREGSVMEDGARLEDLSLLPRGQLIPRGETWAGSPARRAADPRLPAFAPQHAPLRRAAEGVLYALLACLVPLLLAAPIVPGMALLTRLGSPWLYLAVAPAVGACFVVLLMAEVALLKWLLVQRVRAGTYPVHGSFYVRNWIVEQLLQMSLDYAGQLHATLYLAPWFRTLGARLGRFVELSTASSSTPDLLDIGDESTVADEVSLGVAHVERGWLTAAPTRLGRRAFVGNSGVVPAGTELGDGSLVGVLSITPEGDRAAQPGATWLGSPPLRLPRRQESAAFPEGRTFRPSRKLRLARAAFEILRVTLPPAGFIGVTVAVVTAALAFWRAVGPGAALLAVPALYSTCCVAVLLAVAAAKWAVMGRYRPFERPLWSAFVWRLELVNALYEFLATPLALEALQGTPLLAWYLRLLGARIGRGAYLHTTGFLEWDLVEVAEGAALNEDCVMQTHLFEDRVLKASRLRIGQGCVVGAGSVVLYDSELADGARLDALSLVMKGETLPAGTSWAGIPAAFSGEAHDAPAAPLRRGVDSARGGGRGHGRPVESAA
jgi:non-ribosomal peptide synthetase-like protein